MVSNCLRRVYIILGKCQSSALPCHLCAIVPIYGLLSYLGGTSVGEDGVDTEAVVETEEGRELDLAPHNIIDRVVFGRRLRAQRVLQGYDRVGQLTHVLRSRYGVDVSDRTIYAIERGEQMPHADFMVAVIVALDCPLEYFAPAFRADVQEFFVKRWKS